MKFVNDQDFAKLKGGLENGDWTKSNALLIYTL